MTVRVLILVVLFASVCIGLIFLDADDENLLEVHHSGVMMIEQHRFVDAEKVLLRVVTKAPDAFVPRFNLAVAQLNQAEAGVDRARATLLVARRLAPYDARVPYSLGIIHRFVGDEDAALIEYRNAVELAPESPDANYNVAISLSHLDQRSQALPFFEMATRLDPTLLGAWNNLQLIYRRAGRTDDADHALEQFQAMRDSGQGRAQSTKYTEQGKLALAIRDWDYPVPVGKGALAITFAPPVALSETAIDADSPFALVDLDLDCVPDLWLAGPTGRIWSFDGVAPVAHDAPAELLAATTFAVGDIDEDGLPDLVTAADGEIRVFKVEGEPVPTVTPLQVLAVPELGAISELRLVDLDLEGDVDLLIVPESGAAVIAVNEGRTLRVPGAEPSLPAIGTDRVRLVAARSLDSDVDADIVLASDTAPYLRAIFNAPQWEFGFAPDGWGPGEVETSPALTCFSDFGGDAIDDLLAFTVFDNAAWLGVARGIDGDYGDLAEAMLPPGRKENPIPPPGVVRALATTDFDLDGHLDIVVAADHDGQKNAIWVLRNTGSALFEPVTMVEVDAVGLVVGDVDDDFDPDIVVITAEGIPTFLRNTTNPLSAAAQFHAVRLYFGGVRDGDTRRTNLLGYGVRVELRAGDLTIGRTYEGSIGHRAQGIAPLIAGIAGREELSWAYLLWPDGVSQSEGQVPLDACETIQEVQRKSSSCPVLFTWDGREYRFITDFMGGGGLGFWIGPDEFAPPEPTEVVRIAPDALQPIQGELRLSVMEPMQESCTIDRLELIAIDHPEGTEVYPEEYFPVLGKAPSGAPLQIDTNARRFPQSIVDREGAIDPAVVATVDRKYAGPRRLDADLVGYAETQEWIITFPVHADATLPTHLFLDGWVEYPYSRINFAAWQRDDRRARRLEAPSFWWDRGDGDWQLLGTEIGYPAGMPKTMVLDVTAPIAAGATRFKIATNLELYWDRIFLAPVRAVADSARHVVPLKRAELRFGGYPREYSDDGALPATYHYAERDASLGYEPMGGLFTKYGRVEELLTTVDDRFVVMGGGDEIDLVHDATALPPLAPGMLRTYLLDTHGYCKDRDPLTATPDSVEPLPFGAMTAYPPAPGDVEPDRDEYRAKWNTRRDGGGGGVRSARPRR